MNPEADLLCPRELSPLGPSWRKVMMWIFIVGDALIFGSFLTCYAVARFTNADWPEATHVFHLNLVTFMTLILITSGATMARAVFAARTQDWKGVVRFLWFTLMGGALFVGLQGYEWMGFIQEGARLNSNPWGPALFSASFFLITGFHGFHVLTGLIILFITVVRSKSGRSQSEGIELAGMYWAFVDLVWVFIFPTFYLI